MKKTRLIAAFLAAAVMTCGAFGFAGCNDGGDGGTQEKGMQVDSEKWSTEIKKFNLDENLSQLDNYTVKYEMTETIRGESETLKGSALIDRKEKEIYLPDNKPATNDAGTSYKLYLKLGEPYAYNETEMQVCEVTTLDYGISEGQAKIVAEKSLYEYDSALLEFNITSLLATFSNIKVGENVMPLNEAYQYFTFDETDGVYRGQDIGVAMGYGGNNSSDGEVTILDLTPYYRPCEVEISIKESSFTVDIKYEEYFTGKFEICNFNKTQINLSAEVKAELDKLNKE